MKLLQFARRQFEERTLPTQVGASGAALSLTAALAAWLTGAHAWPLTLSVAASGLAVTLLAALLVNRATRALHQVATAARLLSRDDGGDDHDIPLIECCAELRRATSNLRRMVEVARRRQRDLETQNATLTLHLEHRTHELTTLQDLSIGLATKTDLYELVDEALGALEQTVDYSSASMWGRAPREEGGQVVLLGYRTSPELDTPATEDLTGMRLSRANLERYEQIERERQPLVDNDARQGLLSWLWEKITDDARSSALYRFSRSWMALPLKFHKDVLGVMRVDHGEPNFFDAERIRLLTAVGSQAALAMHHAHLQAQEREVAVLAERNRIARDLHDAVSQTLFAANVMAGTLARMVMREPPPPAVEIERQARTLEKLNRGALAEMRLLMFELRADALQNTPLADLLQHAIEALASRGEIDVQPILARNDGFAAGARVQLYRIAQEALSNISRHSGARHAVLEWKVNAEHALLRIADDGCGFDTEQARPGHFGLDNMRSRAQEIGAALNVISAPGQGTELRVELPATQLQSA